MKLNGYKDKYFVGLLTAVMLITICVKNSQTKKGFRNNSWKQKMKKTMKMNGSTIWKLDAHGGLIFSDASIREGHIHVYQDRVTKEPILQLTQHKGHNRHQKRSLRQYNKLVHDFQNQGEKISIHDIAILSGHIITVFDPQITKIAEHPKKINIDVDINAKRITVNELPEYNEKFGVMMDTNDHICYILIIKDNMVYRFKYDRMKEIASMVETDFQLSIGDNSEF